MLKIKGMAEVANTNRIMIDQERLKENKGGFIRMADFNFDPGAGYIDTGLFAVPFIQQDTGTSAWFLVDARGEVLSLSMNLLSLVTYVIRNYGDKAPLTDVARALI